MSKVTSKDQITWLSKKGMKELKKTIEGLECDRRAIQKYLHELERTTNHDERLIRSEKLIELENVESELAFKKGILQNARLIVKKHKNIRAAIGSVVELIDRHGRLFRYTLVDSFEANPSDGRISIKSPIGQNIVGKTVRDIIEWGSHANRHRLQLINIC